MTRKLKNSFRCTSIALLAVLTSCLTGIATWAGPVNPRGEGWLARAAEYINDAEYHVTWNDSAWQAPNRAHDLRSQFTESGVLVTRRTGNNHAWEWEVEFVAYGRGNVVEPAGRPRLLVDRNRIEYARGPVVEWYVNDRRGLEQGFTIEEEPGESSGAPVYLELALHGDLAARFSADGQAVGFHAVGGIETLHYSGLLVVDAVERVLPSWIERSAAGMRILFDDTGAVYPVTVDPVLKSAAWTAEGNQSAGSSGNAPRFGTSTAAAGDVNGDGYDDVIVGAPYYDAGEVDEGAVFVFHGSASGLSASPDWMEDSDQAGALYGEAVAGAGDVNGDGYDDIIVGARLYANPDDNEGMAFVYHGSATGLGHTQDPDSNHGNCPEGSSAEACPEANGPAEEFATVVAGIGDVNCDGFDDVIVATPRWGGDAGRAEVFLGSANGISGDEDWSTGGANQTWTGRAVAGAGNVDGVGCDDFIVAEPNFDAAPPYPSASDGGRIRIFYGYANGDDPFVPETKFLCVTQNENYSLFGRFVDGAGDLNGDGYDDIVVGRPNYDGGQGDRGQVFVYHGSAAGIGNANFQEPCLTPHDLVIYGQETNELLGWSVRGAGNVNGDGCCDEDDSGTCEPTEICLNREACSACTTHTLFEFDDIIYGAYGYNAEGITDSGAVHVHHGSIDGLQPHHAWHAYGDQAVENVGYSADGAGDVNGDGYADIIYGAPLFDGDKTDEGAAFVHHGAPEPLASVLVRSLLTDSEVVPRDAQVKLYPDATTVPPLSGEIYDPDLGDNSSVAVSHGPVPNSVIISTGLAQDEGKGDTDFGQDGEPDYARLRFNLDVPSDAKTLVFTTQLITSELSARPQDEVFDNQEIYFSRYKTGSGWDGCASCHANGDIPSKVVNPPVRRGIGVDGFEEVSLAFGVNDQDTDVIQDGRHDTAMILSNMYFSEEPLPEGRDFDHDGLWDYLPNPSPQDTSVVAGTYSYSKDLMSIPGIGLSFRLTGHYSSASGGSGALGTKWTHSYETSVSKIKIKEDDGSYGNLSEIDHVLVQHGDGRTEYFECLDPGGTCGVGPGLYGPKYAGTYSSIKEDPAGTFTYETREHLTYTFVEDLDQEDGNLTDTYEKYALTSIADLNGNRITLNYDASSRLDYILDTRDHVVTFSYDDNDMVSGVEYTGGGDASVHFEYIGAVDEDGEIVWRLETITDLNGNETSFAYDRDGNLLTVTGADGEVIADNTYESYQGQGLDQTGNRVTIRRDARPGDTGISTEFDGDRHSTSDRLLGYSQTVYDVKGRVVKSRVMLGEDPLCDPDDPVPPCCDETDPTCWAESRTSYYKDNLPKDTWDPLDYHTYTEYDNGDPSCIINAEGQVVSMVYDTDHNMLYRVVHPATDSDCGVPVECTVPSGPCATLVVGQPCFVAAFCYDAQNQLIETYDSNLGKTVAETLAYDTDGLLTSETDRLGNTTDYAYNGEGYLSLEQLPCPDPECTDDTTRPKKAYAYDALGHVIEESICDLTLATCDADTDLTTRTVRDFDSGGNLISETNANGETATYEYDARDRMTRSLLPDGNADILYTYTVTGRPEETHSPEYDEDGSLVRSVTRNVYDEEDRLVAEQDALGRTTSYTCDAADRLAVVTDPALETGSATYDAAGNMLSFTDPESNTTYFTYDGLGRVTTETDPAGNTVNTTYFGDARGLIESVASVRRTIEYGYDDAGRLTDVELWDPSGGPDLVATITHYPDAAGNRYLTEDFDRFPVVSGEVPIARSFDGLGRIVTRTDPFDHTVAYTYDIVGNLVRLCYDYDVLGQTCNNYPFGVSPPVWEVVYEYDILNRLTSVTDWSGNVTSYTYNVVGNVETVTLPDSSTIDYTYDLAHRLTRIQDTGTTYSYDETFTLDAVGRRTGASVILVDPPGFDGVPESDEPFVFVDNEMTSRNALYDSDGNLTDVDLDIDADGPGGPTDVHLDFDLLNQLVAIDENQDDVADVTYRYDADGYRVEAMRGAVTRRYQYDTTAMTPRLLVERDGNGAVIASYVHGLGLISRHAGEIGLLVYHFDSRGSTLAMTGASGDIEVQYRYAPYGGVVDREDLFFAGTFDDRNPFTYNGRDGVFDDGNGLYFMRTRYYAPDLMRFIQKDKVFSGALEDPQSLNRYTFVRGDPISGVDPNGEWVWQAVSVAISVGFECYDGCTAEEAAGAAIEGLISSFGGGIGSSILLGAVGSAAGQFVSGGFSFDAIDVGEVATSAAFGGLGAGAGKGSKGAFKRAAKGSRKAVNEGREAAFKVMKRNAARKAPKNVSAELQEQAIAGTREHARKRAMDRYAEKAAEKNSRKFGDNVTSTLEILMDQDTSGLPKNGAPASDPASARPSPPTANASTTTAPKGPPTPCH